MKRRGQALVEFALALPLLVGILATIIELSWVFYQTLTVSTAARSAARRGVVGVDDGGVRAQAQRSAVGLALPAAGVAITVTDEAGAVQPAGTRTPGCFVLVRVTHDLTFLTPVADVFRRASATRVSAASRFRIE